MVQTNLNEIKNRIESLKIKEVLWVIGLLVFSRLIPHWPNFTALGATAILAPRWLNKNKFSLMIPLLALLISDLIIGFHPFMLFTYSSIFIISFLSWNSKKENLSEGVEILKWGFGASFIFFLLTNLGSWLLLDMYPKNYSGLMLSYWNGIPYFFYDSIGTMFYVSLALYLRSKEKIILKEI